MLSNLFETNDFNVFYQLKYLLSYANGKDNKCKCNNIKLYNVNNNGTLCNLDNVNIINVSRY